MRACTGRSNRVARPRTRLHDDGAGSGTAGNPAEGFRRCPALLERLARGGNADAQYLLGALLLTNPQGEPDLPGPALAGAGGRSGEPRAAYMLSVLAATATPPMTASAARWLEAAATAGIEAAVELQTQGTPADDVPACRRPD